MATIHNRAAANASRKATSATGKLKSDRSSLSSTAEKQLTTYAAFKQHKQAEKHYVTTASGWVFEIQPISPGLYFLMTGTPLIDIAQAQGGDWNNPNDRQQAIERKQATMTAEDTIEFMQRVCCAGITSLNFVIKPANTCIEAKQELPVTHLGDDLLDLFNHIMSISLPESEGDVMATFRGAGAAEQEQPDSDSPVGENLPSTPDTAPIP